MIPHHTHGEDHEALYAQALILGSFKTLVAYPCLLFRWQNDHLADVQRIAKVAAHKNGHHQICGEDCKTIGDFIAENSTQTIGMDI